MFPDNLSVSFNYVLRSILKFIKDDTCRLIIFFSKINLSFFKINPIQDRGWGTKSLPSPTTPTSFSPVTSRNLRIST